MTVLLGLSIPMGAGGQNGSPVPVLLVPGWFETGSLLAPMRSRLIAAGWPESHVIALTFEDRTGSNRDHAREISHAVDSLLALTGAGRVDIVAHSMGGLATRFYLRNDGAEHVRRVVFMATPQRGTYTAYLAFGQGREEMIPGSEFLKELNQGPPVPSGVEALTIRTALDLHVLPDESATLPGVPDVQVCCPTHEGLLRDMDAFTVVRRFLEEGATTKAPGA
jgi:triacylglycerol esterase/lipase EstA (alpha/beta hydrolase family)